MERFLKRIGNNVSAFASMFDHIKDLVFLMETDGDSFRYLYVNKSALRVLHWTEDVLKNRVEAVMLQERAEFLLQKYRKVQETHESVHFIEKIKTESGTFIGDTSLSPIITGTNECHYVLAIVRDITDKRRQEIELKVNQKRLRSLIDHNGEAVFEFDLQGNFISANEQVTEMTGYREDDLIGKSYIPLIIGEFADDTATHFERALQGHNETYETVIYHKNGHKITLLVKNVPIIVDDVLVGVYGIANDITIQNRIKQLLQESKQRYKSLFENHPDGIFTFDLKGSLVSVNASVEKITGYFAHELLGRSFVSMMDSENDQRVLHHFHQAIKEKKAVDYEVEFKHKAGHLITLSRLSWMIRLMGFMVLLRI